MTDRELKREEAVASALAVVDPIRFRQAMRHPACAVAIVSAAGADGWVGITATAVCSLADTPASVLVCINRSSYLSGVIAASGHFCLSYLTAEQAPLADVFAGRTGVQGGDRFRGADWSASVVGAPLLHSALAGFACVLDRAVDEATHTLFIGRVVDATYHAVAGALVYNRGGYGMAAPLSL